LKRRSILLLPWWSGCLRGVYVLRGCSALLLLCFQEAVPFELEETTAFVMEQQKDIDVAIDAIQAKLSNAILENYTRFIEGMKFVQEVDMDISRAEVTLANTLRQIRETKSEFVVKALQAVHRQRRRQRLSAIFSRLNWLKVSCLPPLYCPARLSDLGACRFVFAGRCGC
jgi:hypothetical protein